MHGPVLYAANWTLAVKVGLFFRENVWAIKKGLPSTTMNLNLQLLFS